MSLFKELKRRNVFRVGIVYTVATWLLIQVSDNVYPRIGLPGSVVTLVIAFIYEQDGPSMARLHVAAQTRESEKGSGSISQEPTKEGDSKASGNLYLTPFLLTPFPASLRQGRV